MKFNPDINFLLSYHYFKTIDLDKEIPLYFDEPYPRIFLDSGAWSAFTLGSPIDLKEYVKFITRFSHWFKAYSNLDDLQSPVITKNNQKALEDKGLYPLPVFHTGESLEILEDYVQEYPYVCVGRIIPFTNQPKKIIPFLIQCHKIARGRAVLHGFGVTNWKLLKLFPWYSVDSSSWASGFRYGRVSVFHEDKGTWGTMKIGDIASVRKYAGAIKQAGFRFDQFSDRAKNHHQISARFNAIQYLKAQRFLRKRHGPISLKSVPEVSGLNIHLVTDKPDLKRLSVRHSFLPDIKGASGINLPFGRYEPKQSFCGFKGGFP